MITITKPRKIYDDLKTAVREPVWRASTALARPTAGMRVTPDYLIVGGQRCGTTSLQNVLSEHPAIKSARLMKGVHYFDTGYAHGPEWYRAHFHTEWWARAVTRVTGTRPVVGEASPYYIFHPTALERAAVELPDVKLIALLRDPVERALSHYHHEVRRGDETLPIETAFAVEPDRLAGEALRMREDPGYYSAAHQHHSYVARGMYAEQVERMWSLFPARRTLILPSELFFADPRQAYTRVLRFLDLPEWYPADFPRMNAAPASAVSGDLIERLRDTFAAPNRELYELAGEDFGWQ